MYILKYRHFSLVLLLATVTGCTQTQSPQELKEKTAEATAAAKNDVKAVAEGVRQGWNRDQPLDLNTATKEQLLSLPGVTEAEADRVIAGRPYNKSSEVVSRGIMSKTEYDKIADQITARR